MRASRQVRRAAIKRAIKEHQDPGQAMYHQGYEQGLVAGRQEGYPEGWNAAVLKIQADFEAHAAAKVKDKGLIVNPSEIRKVVV